MSEVESEGLLSRYRMALHQAWSARKDLETPDRSPHEVQFLPAALELQERPIHPAPRVFVWLIMAFVVIALAWACFGRIDVVATAPGKIIPSGKSKVIQASATAVVKAIHVHDGQQVKAGELLIELDSTVARADVSRVQSDLLAASIDRARAEAMLYAIDHQTPPSILDLAINGADSEQSLAAQRWLTGQYQEYRSSLDTADAEIAQRQADIFSANGQIASLQKSLPIAVRLADDYRQLLDKQYIPRHAFLEKEQARLDIERQMRLQQASLLQASTARREVERRRVGLVTQTRRAMLDLLQQAEQQAALLKQDLAKATYQDELTTLESPVDGTVQQLGTHTVGGVVTPAQPLMTIVPSGQPVEIEATLENKDIGFVHRGQKVTVKIETFTFTKYGVISGEVVSVSSDAVEDEKRGLIYTAKIKLAQDNLTVDGKRLALEPGMSISAEVKTDERRVIEYFLSPLQTHLSESLGER
jgi:hemolysin D